jgi:hypothetical protein
VIPGLLTSIADPLAGLELPPGDPGALSRCAGQFQAAAAAIDRATIEQQKAVWGTVGSAWIGAAAESATQGVSHLVTAAHRLQVAAQGAHEALQPCVAAWEQATRTYAQAGRVAQSAVIDEQAHRQAAGHALALAIAAHDPLGAAQARAGVDGSDGYVSPERARAQSLAQEAIHAFNQASTKAAGQLGQVARPLSLQVPLAVHARAANNSGGSSWLHTLGSLVTPVLSFVTGHGGKILLDVGGIVVGAFTVAVGAGGDVVGGALDLTGAGTVIGVPLNVASTAVVVAGGAVVVGSTASLGSQVSQMANQSSSNDGPGDWVDKNRGGGSPRSWEYQKYVTGTDQEYDVPNPETGKPVSFDGFDDGELIDAKGPGYEDLLDGDPDTYPSKGVIEGLLSQAERQIEAAQGTPIVWHIAEEGAAEQIQELLDIEGYSSKINVVFDPPPAP